jgi:hypothetical protein
MKANIGLKANNTYKIELIDSRTGKIKQEGSFHNIITNMAKRMLVYAVGTDQGFEFGWYNNLLKYLRCGSGTNTPTAADTDLGSLLWSDYFTGEQSEVSWPTPNTAKSSCTYTIPASATYVGTVTEIGLYPRTLPNWAGNVKEGIGSLCAHALLTDSEGQLISFEKTDLDILKITVTVEVTLTTNSSDFILFNKPLPLLNFVSSRNGFKVNWPYGSFEVRRFSKDIIDNTPIESYDVPTVIDQGFTNGYKCTNDDTRLGITWPKARLASTVITSERYYTGLAITGLGGWKLPNANIFPQYTISNIPIGTGDGSTTQFLNPLSYFKKNTDKVYKNGVLLTRDVDYIINNISNVNRLPEIAAFAGLIPNKVKYTGTKDTSNMSTVPLLIGSIKPTNLQSNEVPTGFNNSAPIAFEYAEPVTLNYFIASNLRSVSGGGYRVVDSATTFTLEYSNDGETYETAVVATGATFVVDFAPITAKYWRIITNQNAARTIYAPWESTDSERGFMSVGYRDPYITFTVAPAENDVLTMEVEMDIIMKNSNFVIDAEASIDFVVGGN